MEEAVPAPEPKSEWLAPNILAIRDLMHPVAVHQMIEAAEAVGKWKRATVYRGSDDNIIEDASRVCQATLIDRAVDPRFERWEKAVFSLIEYATQRYTASNERLAYILAEDHGYELCRYDVGGLFKEHIDTNPKHPNKRYASRLMSFILYLNEGYIGGGLKFPRHGITFQPSIGSVLMFPSGFAYPHEALPVEHGRKYAVVSWLS